MAVVLALQGQGEAVVSAAARVAGLPALQRHRGRPPDRIRAVTRHPEWCGRGHRCGLGEHRSDPATWRTGYGGLTAARVRREADHIEVRLTVRLPAGEQRAGDVARLVVRAVDLAVRLAVAGHRRWLGAAYQRLTGVRVR